MVNHVLRLTTWSKNASGIRLLISTKTIKNFDLTFNFNVAAHSMFGCRWLEASWLYNMLLKFDHVDQTCHWHMQPLPYNIIRHLLLHSILVWWPKSCVPQWTPRCTQMHVAGSILPVLVNHVHGLTMGTRHGSSTCHYCHYRKLEICIYMVQFLMWWPTGLEVAGSVLTVLVNHAPNLTMKTKHDSSTCHCCHEM
jgi:hypothetical protein